MSDQQARSRCFREIKLEGLGQVESQENSSHKHEGNCAEGRSQIMKFKRLITISLSLLSAFLLTATLAFGSATLTVVSMDGPNEGFNDPTPARPVGQNKGKTVGEQRLIAFQF